LPIFAPPLVARRERPVEVLDEFVQDLWRDVPNAEPKLLEVGADLAYGDTGEAGGVVLAASLAIIASRGGRPRLPLSLSAAFPQGCLIIEAAVLREGECASGRSGSEGTDGGKRRG